MSASREIYFSTMILPFEYKDPIFSVLMMNQIIKNIWNSGYEWRSKAEIFGLPLVHIALGRDQKTGRFFVAKGIIAIGQFAVGVIAIGQFSVGLIFGLAQFAVGMFAVAQFALGIVFGMGQFATGITAIGQFAIGKHVFSQTDPQHFRHLL